MEKKGTLKNRIKELENNNIDFLVENPDSFILNTDYRDKNVFILFTSESLKEENEKWKKIFQFYLDFVNDYIDKDNSKFFYFDIGLNTKWNINDVCIKQYKHGRIVNDDVYESNKKIYSSNRARCSKINSNLKPPKMKTLLRVKCPNARCSNDFIRWKCEECKSEYVYAFDDNLYCGCGGGECKDFTFKCADRNHPNQFIEFNDLTTIDNYYSKYFINNII